MENIWALYYSSCSKNVGNTPKIQPPFIWSFTVKFYCMYLYLNNQTVAVSLYKLCASISKGAQTCSPQPKFETSAFCFWTTSLLFPPLYSSWRTIRGQFPSDPDVLSQRHLGNPGASLRQNHRISVVLWECHTNRRYGSNVVARVYKMALKVGCKLNKIWLQNRLRKSHV